MTRKLQAKWSSCYGLNGDNLDWLRGLSIYSTDHDTESVHWFKTENRVANWELPDDHPIRPILHLPNSSFLPSYEKHAKLRKDYNALVLLNLGQGLQVLQTAS